jgi:hypothetical protein
VTRTLLLVCGLPLLIGAAVALPVGLFRGHQQWGFAAVAFGLCVPPGLVVVALGDYLSRTAPFGRVVAVFAATFVRLAAAFGGGVFVFLVAGPADKADRVAFWLWVLFAYLTTLAVETVLMVRGTAPKPVAGGGQS